MCNWSLYGVTTLFRQLLFSSTMTLQAAVMMSDLNKLKIMNKDTSLMFQRTLLLDFGEL